MQTRLLIMLVTALVAVPVHAANDAPQWARDAAAMTLPVFGADVPGVVLLNEQQVTVEDDGRRILTTREAYRVLSREGQREAVAQESYVTGTGKVKEMKAWVIDRSGDSSRIGKEKVLDVAYLNDDVFNDVRKRVISGTTNVTPGSVFAWEAVSEDKSIFSQFEFTFQDRLPVMVSRFSLTLPSGWSAVGMFFNVEERKPSISGNSWTWEMRNLPFVHFEDASPAVSGLVPRLGVSFFPNENSKWSTRTFASWTDVARFQSELSRGQDNPDDVLARTAKELTAGTLTEWERIGAIGRFVQGIHYIAISTNLGRGGGYRPHAASDVLAKRYGDCKDKANLMRVMLKSVGIESWMVAIHSGDRTYVRPEWPSPYQFNHMIVAVSVSQPNTASSIAEVPKLGRILLFDPTDESTPVGLLPEHEQNSLALVIGDAEGMLIRVPKASPESNHVERHTDIVLDARGSAQVKFTDHALGAPAAQMRWLYARASEPEYLGYVQKALIAGVVSPAIGKISVPESRTEVETQRTVEFTSLKAGQVSGDRLLLFRPAMVNRGRTYRFPASRRSYAVMLDAQSFRETVEIHLPDGFDVDETPEPLSLELPYARFESTFAVKDRVLTFHRSLLIQTATVPPQDYAAVRDFFNKVAGAEAASVVLAKK